MRWQKWKPRRLSESDRGFHFYFDYISVISRHIKNVFQEEVEKKSDLHFLQIANSDKPVASYSLDVIIYVGYRVKSKRGVKFRRRGDHALKDYIIRGCAVNQGRMDQLGGIIRIMKRVDECLDTRQVLHVIVPVQYWGKHQTFGGKENNG